MKRAAELRRPDAWAARPAVTLVALDLGQQRVDQSIPHLAPLVELGRDPGLCGDHA